VSVLNIKVNNDTVHLAGELTRYTIITVPDKKLTALFTSAQLTVDLQQVIKVDTAGLAWLFHLLEQAQVAKCELLFANLPAKLDNLIKLSGVEGFLPK